MTFYSNNLIEHKTYVSTTNQPTSHSASDRQRMTHMLPKALESSLSSCAMCIACARDMATALLALRWGWTNLWLFQFVRIFCERNVPTDQWPNDKMLSWQSCGLRSSGIRDEWNTLSLFRTEWKHSEAHKWRSWCILLWNIACWMRFQFQLKMHTNENKYANFWRCREKPCSENESKSKSERNSAARAGERAVERETEQWQGDRAEWLRWTLNTLQLEAKNSQATEEIRPAFQFNCIL